MLFILHKSEDRLQCETLERQGFELWVRDHVDGIRPESHPKFVSHVPLYEHEYLVIEGRVILPQPVTVVKSYLLP